jgi:hypothetical protein
MLDVQASGPLMCWVPAINGTVNSLATVTMVVAVPYLSTIIWTLVPTTQMNGVTTSSVIKFGTFTSTAVSATAAGLD